MKRFLPFFLAVLMAFNFLGGKGGTAASASSVSIVALGDSISTGWGLPDKQNQLFVNKLAGRLGAGCTNLAVDGTTSTELLNMLESLSSTNKSRIREADIISVSIGGNTLLGPFFTALEKKLGKDVSKSTGDEISDALASILMDKGAQNELEADINAGRKNFCLICRRFYNDKSSQSDAEIVVQTVYNPIYNISALRSLNSMGEEVICAMNDCIKQQAAAGKCLVADVYTAFKVSSDNYITPVNTANFDIHPNATGHNIIYQSVYYALKGESPYAMTASVTGASVTFEVAPSSMVVRVEVTPKTGYSLPRASP
jgi:lysophospholipase L1-like esterase